MIFLIIFSSVILTVCSKSVVIINNNSTLEKYLCQDQLKSETELIVISSVDYEINVEKFCMVQNIVNVNISSDSSSSQVNIICRHNRIGLGFFNTTNLSIQNFAFRNCGAEITLSANVFQATNMSILYIGPHQRSVLLFSHCSGTYIKHVNIEGPYYGFGILSINAFNQFAIDNLVIKNNRKNPHCVQTNRNFSCSGSGIAFVFIDTNFSKSSNAKCCMYLYISNVTIQNVSNFYSYKNSLLNTYSQWTNDSAIMSGTGLTILLCSNMHSIISTITELYISGSSASHAGAVLIFFYNTHLFHHFVVSDVHLENNTISLNEVATSPAMTFLFSSQYNQKLIANRTSSLNIINSYFSNNKGYLGAGLLVSAPPFSYVNANFYIFLCTFVNNKAAVSGSAIYFGASIMKRDERKFAIRIGNINAHGNGDLNGMYSVSVISLSSVRTVVHFLHCNFTQNVGSAIEVYSSTIEIFHSFTCLNNTSNKGSCILLKGDSFVRFYENSSIILKYNRALISGGAVYSNNMGGPSDMCTILPGGNQVFVTTEGNSALFDGDDMKISNLYNCTIFVLAKGIIVSQDNMKFFLKFMNYRPKDSKAIVSRASQLCVCNPNISEAIGFNIYSGVTIQLPVKAVDAGNHPVYTTATVSFYTNDNTKWTLGEVHFYNLYSNLCNSVNITITVDGLAHESEGFFVLQATETHVTSLKYNILITPCPDGFDTAENVGKCQCSSFLLGLNIDITCTINKTQIFLPISSWFGMINNSSTQAFSFTCPPEYCHSQYYNVGTNNSLCMYNRTGVMCGECVDGLSVVFGSDECRQCSNIWLLTLIVYAMVGAFLVLGLFVTKLTISSGPLGGVIFVANMSAISLHTTLLSDNMYTQAIRYLIAFLNLNTGFSVCLYNGMTGISKAAIQFVFPAYLCFIVLIVIVSSRFSSRLTNLIVVSSVQVLATVVHLSFAELLSTVANILISSQVLYSPDYSSHLVWYYDGNIDYFSSGHLVLVIISILIIAIVILPYLMFTSFASHLRRYRFFNLYFRPLIDTYHGPYKDKYGFWCGVRQWLMVLLYIVYSALRGRNPSVMLMTNIVCVGLFLLLQVFLKPFRSFIHNIIENWFVFLLFTTNLVTFYFTTSSSELPTITSTVTGTVLLSLYLLSIILVLTALVIHRYKPSIFSKVTSKFQGFCRDSNPSNDSYNDIHYGVREPLLLTF